MIGSVVGGKYRILRRLGSGGMGTVYEAVHEGTSRHVALKILSQGLASDDPSVSNLSDSIRARHDELVERFKREAQAAGRIRSEHVVQILDAGEDQASDRPYLAMELLDGQTLQELHKRIGPLQPKAALAVCAQLCRGLAAAHAAKVIHRDIKIGNLLLAPRPDGSIVVKVFDFGIAKVRMEQFQGVHEGGLTQTGHLLGSPHYMSPEQAKGLKTIDHRADLWSVGVVLYRILSGTSPFDAPSLGQVLLAICTEEPAPLQARAAWVMPEVVAIVDRALEKDPARRFGSAEELLDALLALLPDGDGLTTETLRAVTDAERAIVAPLVDRNSISETRMRVELDTARQSRSSGRTGWGLALLGLSAAAALMAWHRFQNAPSPGADASASSSPPSMESAASTNSAAAAPPTAIASASAAPAAPPERAFTIRVQPPNAQVVVDGSAVEVHAGSVELHGVPGTIRKVTVRAGNRERDVEVILTERGASPAVVDVGRAAAPNTARPPSAAKTPPAAAATTEAPVAKPAERVGATNSFE